MQKYELVSNYRDNESLKQSFNSLAMKTFNLDFRGWYDKGYWNDNYIRIPLLMQARLSQMLRSIKCR